MSTRRGGSARRVRSPLTSVEIRDAVVRVFDAAREAPGALYEPERFLAYLTEPAAPTGRRRTDTRAGVRRFNRFMDALQLQLGVCFNNKEWEEGLGLDEMVAAVERKLENPGSQRRLAEKRLRQARGDLVDEPIKFALVAMVLVGLPMGHGGTVVRTISALVWIAIVAAIVAMSVRQYRYAQQLAARIASRGGQ